MLRWLVSVVRHQLRFLVDDGLLGLDLRHHVLLRHLIGLLKYNYLVVVLVTALFAIVDGAPADCYEHNDENEDGLCWHHIIAEDIGLARHFV